MSAPVVAILRFTVVFITLNTAIGWTHPIQHGIAGWACWLVAWWMIGSEFGKAAMTAVAAYESTQHNRPAFDNEGAEREGR